MSREAGPANAALIALLVVACGTSGAPTPTAGVPATTAPATPQATASAAGVSCAGDDLLWPLLPQPAQAYAVAWLAGEQSERVALLEEAMAADGSYSDATTADAVSGLPAIAEHIGAFRRQHDGQFLRVRAWEPTDEHHDYVRLRWILCRASDGSIMQEGEDILVRDGTGLIREATRFVD